MKFRFGILKAVYSERESRALKDLKSLDRNTLRDIGIGRGEIISVSRIFSQNYRKTENPKSQ